MEMWADKAGSVELQWRKSAQRSFSLRGILRYFSAHRLSVAYHDVGGTVVLFAENPPMLAAPAAAATRYDEVVSFK